MPHKYSVGDILVSTHNNMSKETAILKVIEAGYDLYLVRGCRGDIWESESYLECYYEVKTFPQLMRHRRRVLESIAFRADNNRFSADDFREVNETISEMAAALTEIILFLEIDRGE